MFWALLRTIVIPLALYAAYTGVTGLLDHRRDVALLAEEPLTAQEESILGTASDRNRVATGRLNATELAIRKNVAISLLVGGCLVAYLLVRPVRRITDLLPTDVQPASEEGARPRVPGEDIESAGRG